MADVFFNTEVNRTSIGVDLFKSEYQNFEFPPHFHDYYVIQVVDDGDNSFYCQGKKYAVDNSQVVLINPGEVHTGCTEKNRVLKYRSFYPTAENWKNFIGESSGINTDTVSFRFRSTAVKDIKTISKIRSLYSSVETENLLEIQESYDAVLTDLLTKHIDRNFSLDEDFRRYTQTIKTAKEYIQDHLDQKLLLEDISKEVHLSQFHFLRIFKQCTGMSIHQYILSMRVEKAKTELRRSKRHLNEIGFNAGFIDQGHFCKTFKKLTGLTPSDYRRL